MQWLGVLGPLAGAGHTLAACLHVCTHVHMRPQVGRGGSGPSLFLRRLRSPPPSLPVSDFLSKPSCTLPQGSPLEHTDRWGVLALWGMRWALSREVRARGAKPGLCARASPTALIRFCPGENRGLAGGWAALLTREGIGVSRPSCWTAASHQLPHTPPGHTPWGLGRTGRPIQMCSWPLPCTVGGHVHPSGNMGQGNEPGRAGATAQREPQRTAPSFPRLCWWADRKWQVLGCPGLTRTPVR